MKDQEPKAALGVQLFRWQEGRGESAATTAAPRDKPGGIAQSKPEGLANWSEAKLSRAGDFRD